LLDTVEIVSLTELKKIVKHVFIFKPPNATEQLVKEGGEVASLLPG